ncbi:hypothetical protein [Streptomyces sp. LaPpAH-108]|uniref:hypothetical protein n=1 Tax=Streptomyces sp. LaPpAH-108 TaxID=1155714 RepID=UPI000369C0B7|nr:hypothetical protein [Streptomyces sp. LaPpAH-108]
MTRARKSRIPQPLWTVALTATSIALWTAWLGWDQHRDVHPDGSTTGPYEPWQVIGLALTLLLPVCWAAYRRHSLAATLGTPLGLAIASFYDWSDDDSGLFVIGVGLVVAGSLVGCLVVTALVRGMFGMEEGGERGSRV